MHLPTRTTAPVSAPVSVLLANPAAVRSFTSFAVFFALLCGVPPPAVAGLPDGRDPGQPVCRARYVAPPWDFFRVFGVYELSNGDRLRVRREALHYFAEMGRTGRIEILPLSEDRFAEKGGPLRFAFNQEGYGDDVVVSGLEQPRPRGRVCSDG